MSIREKHRVLIGDKYSCAWKYRHAAIYTLITYNYKPLTVKHSFVLLIACYFCVRLNAQSALDSIVNKIDPAKWSAAVGKKVSKLEDKLIARSEKALHRLEKQEEKIYTKELTTKDSAEAKQKLAE
ncbi:MAG TPA: hypothetical protein VGI82_13685, partial [Chitinophagaceae bacterium]